MTQRLTQAKASTRKQLDAVLVQLGSQRPSDVWRGMDQVRRWLGDDPENREVYGVLLDAVKENRELREQVRNLLSEMEHKGSKSAREAMSKLPSGVQDFSVDANDAYYAGEYERAIQLYRQVLKLDPENAHAKDHIAKAEIKRRTGETATGLPRSAEQFYRRARSYIAAREVVTAMNLLSAAIEAARAKSMKFPDAEEALNNMNNLLLADDFKQKARAALHIEEWKDAVELYSKALALDPTDEMVKKEAESLQNLLQADTLLRGSAISNVFAPLNRWQSTIDAARLFINPKSRLIRFVEKQINQIRLFRVVGGVIMLISIFAILYSTEITKMFGVMALSTSTPTEGASVTYTPSPPTTVISSSSPTTINYGYTIEYARTYSAPNGRWIGFIEANQIVLVLERKVVGNDVWYFCQWDIDGVINQGWVSNLIRIGSTPAP